MFKSRTIIAITLLGGAQLASDLILMRIILTTTHVKRKDMDMGKRDLTFRKRMTKRFKKLNPDFTPKQYTADLIEAMLDLANRDNLEDCNGLGGSKPETVKDILIKHSLLN